MKQTVNILLYCTMILTSACLAGGGGTTYSSTKAVSPGKNIIIEMAIFEYGNRNVHKSVQPITFEYKINDGSFLSLPIIPPPKTIESKSIYTITLSTEGMGVKAGDTITTRFSYTWHGETNYESDTTTIQSAQQGDAPER